LIKYRLAIQRGFFNYRSYLQLDEMAVDNRN